MSTPSCMVCYGMRGSYLLTITKCRIKDNQLVLACFCLSHGMYVVVLSVRERKKSERKGEKSDFMF
jgi:hypothetical protein